MQNQKLYWKSKMEAEVEIDFKILLGGQDPEAILLELKAKHEESLCSLKVKFETANFFDFKML